MRTANFFNKLKEVHLFFFIKNQGKYKQNQFPSQALLYDFVIKITEKKTTLTKAVKEYVFHLFYCSRIPAPPTDLTA